MKIWDIATGKKLFDLNGHAGLVTSVAFSPDGQRLASASSDQTVKIWDCATGKELFALRGHASDVTSVASGGLHAGWITSVAFSPDGQRLASARHDTTVKIWEIATGKELLALKGDAGGVDSVAFSPDGQRLASAGDDQTVRIWDSATGKELLALKGHGGEVTSLAFSPDGQRLASASSDQTVKIWDSATGKELFALKGHAGVVYDVAFSPDGQRLASAGSDQTVRIWDSATGKELLALKGHAGWVRSVAFSPDGQRLASANQDGSIHLWETTSVPADLQHRREINQMVADLFQQMPLRADVLARLRTMPGIGLSRRQEAITVAETYPEDSSALDALAWELVKLPGGEMSGYRKALRYSEEASQLEPKNGNLLTTLGMAYYRAGNYEKALDTLLRSDAINKTERRRSLREPRLPRHDASAARPRQGSPGRARAPAGGERADQARFGALGARCPSAGLPARSGRAAGKTQAAQQQVNRCGPPDEACDRFREGSRAAGAAHRARATPPTGAVRRAARPGRCIEVRSLGRGRD